MRINMLAQYNVMKKADKRNPYHFMDNKIFVFLSLKKHYYFFFFLHKKLNKRITYIIHLKSEFSTMEDEERRLLHQLTK